MYHDVAVTAPAVVEDALSSSSYETVLHKAVELNGSNGGDDDIAESSSSDNSIAYASSSTTNQLNFSVAMRKKQAGQQGPGKLL